MLAVQFSAFGPPSEVAEAIDIEGPGAPNEGEVVIAVEACPINPADLLLLEGKYGVLPKLPAFAGGEGIGKVQSVGTGVANLKPGDRVLLPVGRGNWRERIKAPAKGLFALPAGADPQQLAIARVNPPTAHLMLHDYVDLKPGDWIIQDAANSGVGHAVIVLAKAAGCRSVNVVRREELRAPLRAIGADVVLVDGPDLAERVAAATGKAPVRLGIDAVGGATAGRLAACLADGGTLVNYGLLSGEDCRISPHELVFRDITVRGFWLAKWFQTAKPAAIAALYQTLIGLIVDGKLKVEVEATYPLSAIKAALAHAAKPSRNGKILLTPQGAGQ